TRAPRAGAPHRRGGQSRLPGSQPRRAQTLDLLQWYEGQLEKRQVGVMLTAPMDAEEIRAFGADEVVIATGSTPAGTGFQRGIGERDSLPGVDRPNVYPVEAVMAPRAGARKGGRVPGEVGNWGSPRHASHLAGKGPW